MWTVRTYYVDGTKDFTVGTRDYPSRRAAGKVLKTYPKNHVRRDDHNRTYHVQVSKAR